MLKRTVKSYFLFSLIFILLLLTNRVYSQAPGNMPADCSNACNGSTGSMKPPSGFCAPMINSLTKPWCCCPQTFATPAAVDCSGACNRSPGSMKPPSGFCTSPMVNSITNPGCCCNQTASPPICGDGRVNQSTEECDDGNIVNNDGCSSTCKTEKCGDNIKQIFEQCDDGNNNDNDGCSRGCLKEFCGDFIKQTNEQCDDGNIVNNDGCSSTCKIEKCGDSIKQSLEECDDGNVVNNDGCSLSCKIEKCGDGKRQESEECDDSNVLNNDGCSSECKKEKCGDNIKQTNEECDDGNSVSNDGCSLSCKIEKCGDGITQNIEECDKGAENSDSSDYCTSNCKKPRCGEGIRQLAYEDCDDGNTIDGDGCSSTCKTESICCGENNQCVDLKLNPSAKCINSKTYDTNDSCQTWCNDDSCCVCNYWSSKNCESLTEEDCPEHFCQWDSTANICRSYTASNSVIGIQCCDDWLNSPEQINCKNKRLNKLTRDMKDGSLDFGDPSGGFAQCSSFKEKYCGHGLGCRGISKKIAVCIDKYPTCSSFNFDDIGCSTFNSLKDAWSYMKNFESRLSPGQTILYSANQCTGISSTGDPSVNPNCSTRTIFTITTSGTSTQHDTCNFGVKCDSLQSGEAAFCSIDGVSKCKQCNWHFNQINVLKPGWIYNAYVWDEVPLSNCSSKGKDCSPHNACTNSATGNTNCCYGECCPYNGKDDLCKEAPECTP